MENNIDSRFDSKTLDEIRAAFKNQRTLEDLDKDSPLAKIGRDCQELFTSGVAILCKSVPVISNLMLDVWEIFNYQHVVMAIGPNVPALAISVVQDSNGMIQALTFATYSWPQMAKEDPSMELGAIVYVGSQVVDYYNNKLLSQEDNIISKQRALSYEAEYLLLLKRDGMFLNEYQEDVIAQYPNGFDQSLSYVRRAVVAPGFS